jgi:hypothetical protein
MVEVTGGVGEVGRSTDRRMFILTSAWSRSVKGGPVAARVPSTPEGLAMLAESLLATDRVGVGVTGSCVDVARILEAPGGWWWSAPG